MEFKKILITPTIAKQYLEANIKNRRVKQQVVIRYTQDILSGRWKEDTGEVLKISKTGLVLDGQHRLHAVIKANKPVYFHVATDIDDSVFDVLDTGSTRNASDAFLIEGIKSNCSVPSIITIHHIFKNGGKDKNVGKQNKLTTTQLLEAYYERQPFWDMVAAKAHKWYISFAKILPPSIIGGMYAIFHEINEVHADDFMEQFATGRDIKNNTIALLRQKLMQDKVSPRKMPAPLRNALIIKTWNHYRKGEVMKIIKFDSFRDNYPVAA